MLNKINCFRPADIRVYRDSPNQLRIAPAFYFNKDSLDMLNQQVEQKVINANLRLSYGLSLGRFTLNYTPKISLTLRNLTSELTGNDRNNQHVLSADSLRNNIWYNHYRIGLDQDYTYKRGNKLRVRLSVPLYFSIIHDNDYLADNSSVYNRLIVNPSLMADYSFSPSFKAVANGYYYKSHGGINDAYNGYILQSYRNLLRNTTDKLFENNGSGMRLGMEYRDVIRMLFLNIGGSYKHSNKNLFYGYNYNGIIGMKTTIDQPNGSDSYNLHVTSSKAIKLWSTKFEATMGMNRGKSDLLLQNAIQLFHTRIYSAGGTVKTSPSRFLNVSYSFAWMKSKQWTEHQKGMSMLTHSHNAKAWLFPTEWLSVNINFDYQYNDNQDNPNIYFADATIRCSGKQVEWELECNNLFNTKHYISTSCSNMATYINSFYLRPRSVMIRARFKLK